MERHCWHVKGICVPCHAMEFKATYIKSALSMLGSAASDFTRSHFRQPVMGNMTHNYKFQRVYKISWKWTQDLILTSQGHVEL